MIELIVNNSYSQIKGLKTEDFSKLKKVLSYTSDPKRAYHSGGFIRTYYLIDKKGLFPTGLLNHVIQHLWDNKISFKTTDKAEVPKGEFPIYCREGLSPYDWQNAAIGRLEDNHRGGIVATTGSGKSLVIGLIAARLKVKTLVIVPTLEIKKQLQASLRASFTGVEHITVENIDSNALKTASGYDCLILDECHHAAAKTYQRLNKTIWTGIYYRFFLTATFFRNETNEQLLFEGICGQPIYTLNYETAVNRGYIVPIEGYYSNLPKVPTTAYTWQQVYSELVVNNDYRNGVIADMLTGLETQHKFTLCLVKEVAHGKILSEMTGVPFVNGQDEESRKYIQDFNSGKIKALIGTTGIVSEGVDTKPAEYVIIAGAGKAKSAFMQAIGRVVRTYPGKESGKVILFRDASHKFLLRHFNAQYKILKEEYGVTTEVI